MSNYLDNTNLQVFTTKSRGIGFTMKINSVVMSKCCVGGRVHTSSVTQKESWIGTAKKE